MEKGEGGEKDQGAIRSGPVFRGRKRKKRNESGREKREAAPCKKAESNHDQARIWASKVRVRTQLRTRNAITRVSNPLVHTPRPAPLDPFLPDPVHSSFFFRQTAPPRPRLHFSSTPPLSLLLRTLHFLVQSYPRACVHRKETKRKERTGKKINLGRKDWIRDTGESICFLQFPRNL